MLAEMVDRTDGDGMQRGEMSCFKLIIVQTRLSVKDLGMEIPRLTSPYICVTMLPLLAPCPLGPDATRNTFHVCRLTLNNNIPNCYSYTHCGREEVPLGERETA